MRHNTSSMDVVYVLRAGENEEFRYSLRSVVANFPHRKVWAAGGRPEWFTGPHIPVTAGGSKYANASTNLRAAVHTPEVSDEFWLFNDDFFVISPLTEVPNLNRGPLAEILAWYETRHPVKLNGTNVVSGYYTLGMRNTYDLLVRIGHGNPKSYELHVPLRVNKAVASRIYTRLDRLIRDGFTTRPLHWRTIYGNLARLGGTPTRDVKIYGRRDRLPPGPFASTNDMIFKRGVAGFKIRDIFPTPSVYETATDTLAG